MALVSVRYWKTCFFKTLKATFAASSLKETKYLKYSDGSGD